MHIKQKRVLSIVIAIGITITAISLSGCTEEEEKIIVGTSADFPPFEDTENGKIVGFDIDLIKSILKDQGYKVEVRDIKFDSLIPNLEAKKIDVIAAAMSITEEREQQVSFSDPYYDADQSIIVRDNSNIQLDSPQDLQNYTVGAQQGTTGSIWVEENLIDNGTLDSSDFNEYDTYTEALLDLNNENIDAIVLDKPVAAAYESDKNVKIIATIDTGEQYGFAVRKGSDKLLEDINDGLADIKGTDEWNDMVDKWFG